MKTIASNLLVCGVSDACLMTITPTNSVLNRFITYKAHKVLCFNIVGMSSTCRKQN